jgi:hypothetical protein
MASWVVETIGFSLYNRGSQEAAIAELAHQGAAYQVR